MMKYPITAMRLRSLLDEKGLTPQELADKSSVSKSSISLYLHGYNEPKSKNAKKMADILGCHPMWLMGFDEETISLQEEVKNAEMITLTPSEKELIDDYRSLSAEDKDRISRIIKSLL